MATYSIQQFPENWKSHWDKGSCALWCNTSRHRTILSLIHISLLYEWSGVVRLWFESRESVRVFVSHHCQANYSSGLTNLKSKETVTAKVFFVSCGAIFSACRSFAANREMYFRFDQKPFLSIHTHSLCSLMGDYWKGKWIFARGGFW